MLTGKTVFQIKSKAANRFFKKPNQTKQLDSTAQRSLVTLTAVAVDWSAQKTMEREELETRDHSTLSSSSAMKGSTEVKLDWRGTGEMERGFLSVSSPSLRGGK